MSKPLSKLQKATLCQASNRAHAHQKIEGIDRDTYRHDEIERLLGKAGLRECDNGDYNRLLAHFESLAGEDGRAMNALVREQTESRRQAEAVLLRTLSAASLPLAYAESISQGKFSCSVLETDARQLWQLVYTVKGRITQKRRRATPTNP